MAEQVLLYPVRNGAGQGDKTKPSLFPIGLVNKMLNNGWSKVPDVSDRKVAEHLIESAQSQVRSTLAQVGNEKAELALQKAEFLKEKAEFDALKTSSNKKNTEV